VARVAQAIARHKTRVLDFDLGSFFDSVRHHLLFEKVARRVDDPEVTDAGPKPKRFRLEEVEFRRWLYDELELFNDYRVRHAAPKALSAR
jgi:retron-type reverse transcriptase